MIYFEQEPVILLNTEIILMILISVTLIFSVINLRFSFLILKNTIDRAKNILHIINILNEQEDTERNKSGYEGTE